MKYFVAATGISIGLLFFAIQSYKHSDKMQLYVDKIKPLQDQLRHLLRDGSVRGSGMAEATRGSGIKSLFVKPKTKIAVDAPFDLHTCENISDDGGLVGHVNEYVKILSEYKEYDNSDEYIVKMCDGFVETIADRISEDRTYSAADVIDETESPSMYFPENSSKLATKSNIIVSRTSMFIPVLSLHKATLKDILAKDFHFQFSKEYHNYKTFYLNNIRKSPYLEDEKHLEQAIDIKWMNAVNAYIQSLSNKDILTILAYTYHGDEMINDYLRNGVINMQDKAALVKTWDDRGFPFFSQMLDHLNSINSSNPWFKSASSLYESAIHSRTDSLDKFVISVGRQLEAPPTFHTFAALLKWLHTSSTTLANKYYAIMYLATRTDLFDTAFWESVMDLYVNDLNRIIDKTPPLTQELIVYRGIDNASYMVPDANKLYKNNGFISTSFDMTVANRFGKNIQRIILMPGTRIFPISGVSHFNNEKEILLGSKTVFYVSPQIRHLPIYTALPQTENSQLLNVCHIDKFKKDTYDIVVVV